MMMGIGVSDGIGIGTAVVIRQQAVVYEDRAADPAAEQQRFQKALEQFCQNTEKLAEEIERTAGEKEGEILRGHILMMQDPFMQGQIKEQIDSGSSAESSVNFACELFINMFEASGDDLTMQRAADVRDIRQRLFDLLTDAKTQDLSKLPPHSILVAEDLTPSMTARMDKSAIAGIVTQNGGRTSHSAILARALRIPAVLQVENAAARIQNGDLVALDGSSGEVAIRPDEALLGQFQKKKQAYDSSLLELHTLIGKPAQTVDGHRVELFANIGSPKDLPSVLENDCEGIGLFRTEFLFMDREKAPSLEEQFEAYQNVVTAMNGKPVIIRTLDVGGDKDIPYLGLKKEENPFLGFRAVRYCLQNEALYHDQLKALVMASAYGDLRIMIPLVTTVSEVRAVKAMVQSIREECQKEGISIGKTIPVGVMIETPAACMIADYLAEEADFFSIGTNDLTQYTMAVDRGNPDVAYLYSTYDPAVLRAIEHTISCARKARIPAGMCGESAADPLLTPLLISYGLDEFSVSPSSALSAKKAITQWNLSEANEAAEHIRSLRTAEEVKNYLIQIQK